MLSGDADLKLERGELLRLEKPGVDLIGESNFWNSALRVLFCCFSFSWVKERVVEWDFWRVWRMFVVFFGLLRLQWAFVVFLKVEGLVGLSFALGRHCRRLNQQVEAGVSVVGPCGMSW